MDLLGGRREEDETTIPGKTTPLCIVACGGRNCRSEYYVYNRRKAWA